MTAYYNEINPYAAQWLRNLIQAGHIAPGIVDERSIEDVLPSDLAGFTQCHFFAGVGVWSLALRNAGWPDSRPVWTGSCPCQSFSTAGKGAGFADERHLWPAFFHLISECAPAAIFGEQVASKDVEPWIDLVQSDVEEMGYAFGCVAFPSAGVGAPHIRDRAYWLACSDKQSRGQGSALNGRWNPRGDAEPRDGLGGSRVLGLVADTESERRGETRGSCGRSAKRTGDSGELGALAHTCGARPPEQRGRRVESSGLTETGFTRGFWSNADWLHCRDEKWRPVEPGTFPLAHGAPARVGRLRAYGNAINAEAARIFIESTGLI